jgi:hypothetical protein
LRHRGRERRIPRPRSYRVGFSTLERAFTDLELEWDARRGAEDLVAGYRRVGPAADELDSRHALNLAGDDDFVLDRTYERLAVTHCQGGFLRRRDAG